MKKSLFLLTTAGLLVWSACGKKVTPSPYDTELDLKEHGIPIKIKAPKDAQQKATEVLGLQDVKVEGKDYYIQIYGSDATQTDRKALRNELLGEVKADASCTFTRLVLEEDFGFVYEKVCKGDTTKFFDFRYGLLRGDKAYTFQTTNTKTPPFTQDQVKEMYMAIKQETSEAVAK